MQILNATKSVKSILADDGELITILPGEVSKLFTASSHTIRAAINLGEPNQIGIVLGGSWERDIAKTILACADYLYTDLDEAKSKLLDPSIDYKNSFSDSVSEIKNTANDTKYQKIISELESKLRDKDNRISELENNVEFSNLQAKYDDSLERIKELEKERNNFHSQLQDSQDQLASITKDYTKVKDQFSNTQAQLIESSKTVDDLSNKISEYEAKLNSASSEDLDELKKNVEDLYKENQDFKSKLIKKDEEIENLTKNLEKLNSDLSEAYENSVDPSELESAKKLNEELKANLNEATSKIESMVKEFNAACEKFNITKDENGEWIQN